MSTIKENQEKSKEDAKHRILGTLLGVSLAMHGLDNPLLMNAVSSLTILVLLWISKVCNTGEVGAGMACVAYFTIALAKVDMPIPALVLTCVCATMVGIIVAISINKIDFKYIR